MDDRVAHGESIVSQRKKRVTIRDLAKELGLSDRAVSQALNPRKSNVVLNPKTVERIQKLAVRRNYRRDASALSLRYGRFYNVGYFEAKKSAVAWSLLGAESGVFDAASEHNYRVVLIRLPSDLTEKPGSVPRIFLEGNLDALILSHAGDLPQELEEVIDASGFPIVYLNEKKENNAVYVDDFLGGVENTRHLLSLGHRKIIFYSSQAPHYSAGDRSRGYIQAMEEAKLKPEIIDTEAAMTQRIKAGGFDAVVAFDDFTALQFFRQAYLSPFKIPENVSIVGFGDDFARQCSPVPLTTMKTPFYEMGRAAVEMALELVEEKKNALPSRIFKPQLIVRNSTGKRA